MFHQVLYILLKLFLLLIVRLYLQLYILPAQHEDTIGFHGVGGNELHAVARRRDNGAGLQVVQVPGRQSGLLVLRVRHGDDGDEVLPVGTHRDRLDVRQARKRVDRDRIACGGGPGQQHQRRGD